MRLVELDVVEVVGSMEDEMCLFIWAFMKHKLCNV
jgi:hypothetical protein